MTLSAFHAAAIALIGAFLVTVVVLLMRRGLLAVRYGFGWAMVGVLAIIFAPTVIFLEPVAAALGLSVPGLAIAIGVGFLVLVCLQLSITLSGVREQVRTLAEYAALADAKGREGGRGAGLGANGTHAEDRQVR